MEPIRSRSAVVSKKTKRSVKGNALASNRSASHEFSLSSRYEAGIVLRGTEVKSARAGRVNIKDGYAVVADGEILLHNVHFSPYEQGNRENVDPLRVRKLLLHAGEIRKIARETEKGGVTVVPTRLYLKNGRIKLEVALARAKKLYDKREAARRREQEREMDRDRGAPTTR